MFTSVSVIAFVSSSLATVVIVDTLAADNKGSVMDVNVPCPPWYQYDATKQQCVCHEAFHQKIMCSDQGALLEMGSCTTHNRDKGTVIAQCLYFQKKGYKVAPRGYIILPDNITQLNDYMCGPLNRKGILCTECINDFGPSFASLEYKCSNCTGHWYGVPLYLLAELGPITIFYLVTLIFPVSYTHLTLPTIYSV